MYKEVGLVFAVSFLEVAVGFDMLKAHFAHQPTRVVLAQREHVEMIDRTIGELSQLDSFRGNKYTREGASKPE